MTEDKRGGENKKKKKKFGEKRKGKVFPSCPPQSFATSLVLFLHDQNTLLKCLLLRLRIKLPREK